ncbi:MAG: alpha-amylase family glycosyl hydrolase [Bacteroidota bacterium]
MKRISFLPLSFFFFLIFAFCLLPFAFGQLPPSKPIKVKVAVVIQDPVLPQYGGKRLHQVVKTPNRTFEWNDPYVLNKEYEAALEKMSHGTVQYEVVKIIDADRFFSRRNDNNELLSVDEMVRLLMEPDWGTLKGSGTYFDYKAFVEYYGFDKMRDRNQINEVWVWSFPYGGMWESNYCGATGFWLNSEPTTTTGNKELLVVMGLNYERKMSLALESYGHRFESVMWHLYDRWDYDASDPNNWEKYTRFNKTHPGLANIGNIHFPPNGMHDYDWINKTPVTSCADGWQYYPDIKPDMTRTMDCSEWQCTHEGYMDWWFSHIPYFEGINPDDGHLNNWWHYVVKWEEAIQLERIKNKDERIKRRAESPSLGSGRGWGGYFKTVSCLISGTGTNSEQKAAYSFLQNQQSINTQSVATSNLNKLSGKNKPDIIWYHEPDSTVDIAMEAEKLAGPLKKYVEQGGSLLLTLDAVRLLPYLGVEDQAPSVNYTKLVDNGDGRKLGLHSFRSHPVFDGMLGGAYVYAPKEDVNVRRVGWFGDIVPEGKVVGVDWAYIFLHENTKLITEYTLGKGKILAAGAYLYFDQPNFNRTHLEKFTRNVLNYLTGVQSFSPARYWDFEPNRVVEEQGERSKEKGESGKSVIWQQEGSGITLKGLAAPKNMWDIAGERMVLMGKEIGGIDEVWAHPVMAMRDYAITVRTKDPAREVQLNILKPGIEVRPESFTRNYAVPGGQLKEIITVHPTDGNAVIHYEYSGKEAIELQISLKSNLRFMWPYSEKVTGEIHYSWDKGLNAWMIWDKTNSFATVIGVNVPVTAQSGNPDPGLSVAVRMTIEVKPAGIADVVLGTSATGVTEAISAYKRAINAPDAVYAAAVDYSKSLFNGKLTITSPDETFNTGYKWALVGTDRFIVNTPGVGRSLVAGYATTDYGWNGAQKVNGRPGYAWYFGRDAVWSGFAVLDYGDFDRVKTILELFSRYQDISGKIYHELTTSGIAHFDAADATPLYIVLAGKYLHHSGDTAFIRKEWPAIKKAIDFCYSTDTDGDHLIENTQQGHGWEEGGELYVTHTTQYMVSCWAEALTQAAYMARYIGLDELQDQYEKEAAVVLNKLNDEFWNPETKFFNHGIFKDGTYLTEPSVMTAIPLHWGQIRDPRKSANIVAQLGSCNFTTDWGTRIVSEKAKFFAPGGYHTGSVWPLFTGWASLGDFASGNSVQGFSKMMSNLLIYKRWSLGYIEEVLHGTQYKYFGVCRHQCWSETMVLQPAIDGMLGLKPDAMASTLGLTLNFPFDWNSVTAENIRVGDNSISLRLVRNLNHTSLYLTSPSSSPHLTIYLTIPLPKGTKVTACTVNGQSHEYSMAQEGIAVELKPAKDISVVISHEGGISVLPVVHHPEPGDSSTGLKIISDELIGNRYVVKVEGLSGTPGKISLIKSGQINEHEFVFPESKEKYARKDLVFYNGEPEHEVVYYVLPRSFYDSDGDRTGDLEGLRHKLDYLQELGVTSILTLPLFYSDFYHNYFALDYQKIDPEYGTMDDLVTLIREVHKRGMKFYLDMETQYVTEGSDWFKNKPEYQFAGTIWGKLLAYNGISRDFNMANLYHPEVSAYFHDLYRFFLDPDRNGRFDDGVDGFRIDHIMDNLDNAGKLTNLYAGFWKPLFDELRQANPDIRIIGEQGDWNSYGEEIFKKADLDYLFAFQIGFAINSMDKEQIVSKLEKTCQVTPGNKEQLIFLENHDVDRFASRMNGSLQKEKIGAAFNILAKGIPLIYYGQELGMRGVKLEVASDGDQIPRREAFEWYRSTEGPGMAHWYKDSGPWWTARTGKSNDGISLEEEKSDPQSLWNFYKKLISVRKSHHAILGGDLRIIKNDNPGVVSFARTLDQKNILVVINLTGASQRILLQEPLQVAGSVLLSEPAGNRFTAGGITLKPYGLLLVN